jgi:hypothetical protein
MPGSGRQSDRGIQGYVFQDKPLKLRGASSFESQGAVRLFDDFEGDVLNLDPWTTTENGAATPFQVNLAAGAPVAGHGGWLRATTGAVAGNDEGLNGALIWRADRAGNGFLVMEARIATGASVASVRINVGLYAAIPGATAPTTLSGTTFTTNQADGVGFVFDTDSTADDWEAIGVKAGVDSVSAATGVAVLASTAYVLRLTIDSAGNAAAYVGVGSPDVDNVKFIGAMPAAVTPTVLLQPGIHIEVDDAAAAAKSMDVDYVLVSCQR